MWVLILCMDPSNKQVRHQVSVDSSINWWLVQCVTLLSPYDGWDRRQQSPVALKSKPRKENK